MTQVGGVKLDCHGANAPRNDAAGLWRSDRFVGVAGTGTIND